MDDLTALRELGAGAPPPTARALFDGRRRLRAAMAEERGTAQRPGVLRPAIAGAAIASVVALAALVASSGDGPPRLEGPRVQITAAGQALQLAAAASAKHGDVTTPRDDQYIYRREVVVERPLDGGEARRFVDESWTSVDERRPSRSSELGRSWTGAANWLPRSARELARLPTDPSQLLLLVRDWPQDGRRSGAPMSPEDYRDAYMFIAMLLHHSPVLAPSLRATLLEALARIPGIVIADDRVDFIGHRAIAIRRPGDPITAAIVLDRRTYEYLGWRDTDVRPDGEHVERLGSVRAMGVVDRMGERP